MNHQENDGIWDLCSEQIFSDTPVTYQKQKSVTHLIVMQWIMHLIDLLTRRNKEPSKTNP